MLELIEFVLKPFVHATELVSGSKYPTIGLSYFAIFQIRDFLEDVDDYTVSDWKILHYLKSLLSKQVKKYFFDNYPQLKTMKVDFLLVFYLMKNSLYILRCIHTLIQLDLVV